MVWVLIQDPYVVQWLSTISNWKVTYGFGDIGSRRNMNLKPEDVMVTIPAGDLERIIY